MDPEPCNRERKTQKTIFYYLNFITVEPSLILYILAFSITSDYEYYFFAYKTCTGNYGYDTVLCRDIGWLRKEDIFEPIHVAGSNCRLWNYIVRYVGQIILAFFMGAWSDKRGRKLTLLLGLIGKLYYFCMMAVNASQPTWPAEYIIYTATLPMILTGADVAIFVAAFAYLADISSNENRTKRLTLLEACCLATMFIGTLIATLIFREVDVAYTMMFVISAGLLVVAILYSFARLKWRTSADQKPLSEAKNFFLDFFDYNHPVETVKTVCKKRENKKRRVLLILILMMALHTFQEGERIMMFYYCVGTFYEQLGEFSVPSELVQNSILDLGLLFTILVMIRMFRWKDTIIIMMGATVHIVARVFYSTAWVLWIFYVGAIFAAFGRIVAPVIRSMLSKIVLSSEIGKAFSVLTAVDYVISLVSRISYFKLYGETSNYHPKAIFYSTMAFQVGVLLLVLYIHFFYKEDKPVNEDDEVQSHCLEVEQAPNDRD